MNEIREWKMEDIDDILKFKQNSARFGQSVSITVNILDTFVREFTGDLSSSGLKNVPIGDGKEAENITFASIAQGLSVEYRSEKVKPYVNWFKGYYTFSFRSIAGEPSKKMKQSINEDVIQAIGYLSALPIDEGE